MGSSLGHFGFVWPAMFFCALFSPRAHADIFTSGFEPKACAAIYRDLARAAKDVREGLHINVAERLNEILRRSNENYPVVPKDSPSGVSALLSDFESLCADLARHSGESVDLQWARINEFKARWQLEDPALFSLVQLYRTHGKYRAPLQALVTPADIQRTRTLDEKYELFSSAFPALKQRSDYYEKNVGRLSVPEMAAELRGLDPQATEDQVRRELSAIHLRISEKLTREPIAGAARSQVNALLLSRGGEVLGSEITTKADAIEILHERGVGRDDIAEALRMQPQQVSFYLHFANVTRRHVVWDRTVQRPEGGSRSEVDYLVELLGQVPRPSHAQIAEALNEARARVTGQVLLPSDPEFRTVNAVSHKIGSLSANDPISRTGVVAIEPFGVVKEGGKLQPVEALLAIRELRARGHTLDQIAQLFEVTPRTIQDFEAKWSEELSTGLPGPLRRFLRAEPPQTGTAGVEPPRNPFHSIDTPSGRGESAEIKWAKLSPPAPGQNPLFDAFDKEYGALGEWRNTSRENFSASVTKLASGFTEADRAAWSAFTQKLNPNAGALARADTPGQRANRFRIYTLLTEAIARYNANPLNVIKLDPARLKDPHGMSAIVTQLTGETLAPPRQTLIAWEKVEAPIGDELFDQFAGQFSALKNWPISEDAFRAQKSKLAKYFTDEEKVQWDAFVDGLTDLAGHRARNKTGSSQRNAQYYIFRMLKEAIAKYNRNPSNVEKLAVADLGHAEGMRAIVSRLTGEVVEAPTEKANPWVSISAPKEEPKFSAFQTNFGDLANWEISSPAAQARAFEALTKYFGKEGKEGWAGYLEGINPKSGILARSDEDTGQRRNNRYKFYLILKEAMNRYNANPLNQNKLEPSLLESGEGMREAISRLTGEPLAAPKVTQMKWDDIEAPEGDSDFDAFEAKFANLENWPVNTPRAFQAAQQLLAKHFSEADQKSWATYTEGLSPSAGVNANATKARQSRTNNRYRVYLLLREAIEKYNANPANVKKLDRRQLSDGQGMRDIVQALTDSPVAPPTAINWSAMKPPPDDSVFTGFEKNFGALDAWGISNRQVFDRGMQAVADRMTETGKTEWQQTINGLSPSTGMQARSTQANTLRVTSRYRLYRALQIAIRLYNTNPANTQKLDPKQLETAVGIESIFSRLTGQN